MRRTLAYLATLSLSVAGCTRAATAGSLASAPEAPASTAGDDVASAQVDSATSSQRIVGALEAGDLAYVAEQTLYDEFEFELQAGWSIHFMLQSDELDPFLLVRDSSDGLVAYGDDDPRSGSEYDSELTYTATEQGKYYVSVNARDRDTTGTYVLFVEVGPDVPPAPGRYRIESDSEAYENGSDEYRDYVDEYGEPPL